MEIATLRNMSEAELKTELQKQERMKFGLSQGLKMGEVKDTAKLLASKKAVAQIKTILTERKAGGGKPENSDN